MGAAKDDVEAEELRIVSDELWSKVHKRLDTARKTYLRQQNGQLWGRPPTGVAGKYLLTGMARCGHCGAGLEVRSRASSKRRLYYYACSSYWRRGKAVCANAHEIPMKAADTTVVDALVEEILTPDRLAQVAEQAVQIAKAEQEAPDARTRVERQLTECKLALERLTAAVAEGGDVPALVEAIKVQDRRRLELETKLDALDSPTLVFDAQMEQQLRLAVNDWREVLGRQVAQARQIVTKLLVEKLTFTPMDKDGRQGFRFQATGTVEKLVAGAIPGLSQAVVSPTGTGRWKTPIDRWFPVDGSRRATPY